MLKSLLSFSLLLISLTVLSQDKKQCQGITKAGARCTRLVKGSDTCHQHKSIHSCKWELCPYTGTCKPHYKVAVIKYVGSHGTDAYFIDSLHLAHPSWEYEKLEAKLKTIK